MNADTLKSLEALKHELASFTPANSDEVALCGFMIGATYSLQRCVELDYDDSHTRPQPDALTRFPQVAKAIASGSVVEKRWLGGYFFNNAVMRLASLNERIDIYLQAPSDAARAIRQANNDLKHEVDAHLYRGWELTFEQAINEALRLLRLLKGRRLTLRDLRRRVVKP